MRKIKYIITSVLILLCVVSCDNFLGDNVNPNQAVSVTPQLVLPNALTRTADLLRAYNDAGSWIVGYIVNAGGFAGFGSVVTYNYTTNDHAGLWTATYDDLNNYEYILDNTEGKTELSYFNAAAKTMKAFNFQLLVDFFGDVPYSQALQGSDNVNPVYEDDETIYQDLVLQLNDAIAVFTDAGLIALNMGASDVMFGGDVTRWAQFANTLKLRLLVRMSGVASLNSFVTSQFGSFNTAVGILADDAMINPGYLATDGKQNPMWATYHSNAAGAQSGAGRSRIPSRFVWSYYDGVKIFDNYRASKTFKTTGFAAGEVPPKGILGNQTDTQPFAPTNYMAWYNGTGIGSAATNTTGLFKGRTAGSPVILEAEGHLLMAEAELKGLLPSGDAGGSQFDAGIRASFEYLYKNVSNVVTGNPALDVVAYKADNASGPGERFTDYSAAVTTAEKLQAIITQKYIALNFIHGHEAWSEFRRTGYPAISAGSTDPTQTFASITSTSPRPDRLPIRVLYAASEYQLNEVNVPKDVSQFEDAIFWQQ